MSIISKYQSNLFQSIPENSGYLSIFISENSCDIAISSSTYVLSFLERYEKSDEVSHDEFIREIFATKQALFARGFKEVNIGIQSQDFTLIPESINLNVEDTLSVLVNTNQKHIFQSHSNLEETKLVFAVSDEIVNLLNQSFEKYNLNHCISYFAKLAYQTPEDGLIIMGKQHFDIVMKKNEKIYSINRHEYQSAEDITYFTLLACKDAEIEAKDCKLSLSGKIDKNDSINQQLREFILDTHVSDFGQDITTRPDFDQPRQYIIYSLNLLHASY